MQTGTRTRRYPRRRAGMTLVELVIAIVVVVIAGVGLMGAYQSAIHVTEVSQQANVALNDLRDIMERIKATPYTALTATFPDGVVDGGNPGTYGPMVGGYTLQGEAITVTHQPDAVTNPRELVVQVTWTNRGRQYQRTISTMRSSESS